MVKSSSSEPQFLRRYKKGKKSTQETVSTPLKYTFKTIKFHNMKIFWWGVWEKIALKDGGHTARVFYWSIGCFKWMIFLFPVVQLLITTPFSQISLNQLPKISLWFNVTQILDKNILILIIYIFLFFISM